MKDGIIGKILRTGYETQHIIPKELGDHQILRKIGMDLDDASNGIFLRGRTGGISTMSRHDKKHRQYKNIIEQCLNIMDISKSIPELEKEVYELQQAARRMMEAGIPIYRVTMYISRMVRLVKKAEKYMVLVVVLEQNSF